MRLKGQRLKGGSEMKINGPDVATTRGTCYCFFCPFILP